MLLFLFGCFFIDFFFMDWKVEVIKLIVSFRYSLDMLDRFELVYYSVGMVCGYYFEFFVVCCYVIGWYWCVFFYEVVWILFEVVWLCVLIVIIILLWILCYVFSLEDRGLFWYNLLVGDMKVVVIF